MPFRCSESTNPPTIPTVGGVDIESQRTVCKLITKVYNSLFLFVWRSKNNQKFAKIRRASAIALNLCRLEVIFVIYQLLEVVGGGGGRL